MIKQKSKKVGVLMIEQMINKVSVFCWLMLFNDNRILLLINSSYQLRFPMFLISFSLVAD